MLYRDGKKTKKSTPGASSEGLKSAIATVAIPKIGEGRWRPRPICYRLACGWINNPGQMKTAEPETAGTKARWRFAIWLVLAAFTLQSYIVQTHIHDTAPAGITNGFAKTGHGETPVDNGPLDCPFCQAALSGAFTISATQLVFLSAAGIFLAAPDRPATTSYDTVAHIWRSRAPPQQ